MLDQIWIWGNQRSGQHSALCHVHQPVSEQVLWCGRMYCCGGGDLSGCAGAMRGSACFAKVFGEMVFVKWLLHESPDPGFTVAR